MFTSSEKSVVKANIKYGFIGVVVGTIISVLRSLFSGLDITGTQVAFSIVFSIAITLSITNSLYVYERYLKPRSTSFRIYIAGFYCCNLVGMFIGTELSYLLISGFFHTKYRLTDHLADYNVNFFVVLVVSSLLLIYRAQKANLQSLLTSKELDLAKAGQLKTQAELQTLQSRINPHFLYNSLNSIASLIHEDPDKAEEMTLKLSKLFRYSINSMQESFSTIKEELDILNTYLDIEKIRFGNRVNFQLHIADGLQDALIPRFLIQPLVENALKHGLKDKAHGGYLSVEISLSDRGIVLLVGDNGIPFPDELSVGYGLQSTYDKLQLLYGDGYEIKINNLPSKTIKILIPENHENYLEDDHHR